LETEGTDFQLQTDGVLGAICSNVGNKGYIEY